MKELTPYHREQDLTWKGYLAGQLFTLAGMAAIANGVEGGIKSELSKISDRLGAEYNYSMSLVISQLEAQQRIFESILDKLDEIHKTLNSPLLTQARELCKMGFERLSRGLLDKSLEAFLESEKKNDTDFLVQLQIGKLYLYGKDDDDDVINFDEAEKHLILACRYSQSEVKFLDNGQNNEILADVKRLCGESFFHVGALYLVKGNEAYVNGGSGESYYHQAMISFEKAALMNPDFAESFYSVAKSAVLLNDRAKCIEYFKKAVTHDIKYLKKVELDKDFELVREEIKIKLEKVTNNEFETKKNETMAKYKELKLLMSNIDSLIIKCNLFFHSHSYDVLRTTLRIEWGIWCICNSDLQGNIPTIYDDAKEEDIEKLFEDQKYFEQYARQYWKKEGWGNDGLDKYLKIDNKYENFKYGLKREVKKTIKNVEAFISQDSIAGYEKAIDVINKKLPDYRNKLVKLQETIEYLIKKELEDKEKEEREYHLHEERQQIRTIGWALIILGIILGISGANSVGHTSLVYWGIISFFIGMFVRFNW